jgi:dephospho-CoA kinase
MNNSQTDKQSPFIIFLTGASGAGKTTLVNSFNQETQLGSIKCLHFDSIGVPPEEEMIKNYGSGSKWQETMTYQWVNKMATDYNDNSLIIFEGQVNILFIISAFKKADFHHYKIILVHCDNLTRHRRLSHDRKQPELVNENMDNWSNFLKKQATDMDISILNTTSLSVNELKNWLKDFLIRAKLMGQL